VVSDELLAECDKQAPRPTRPEVLRELAAKQLACSRAGVRGRYWRHPKAKLSAKYRYRREFGADDCGSSSRNFASRCRRSSSLRARPGTGLSEPTRINPQFVQSLQRPGVQGSDVRYRLSRWYTGWLHRDRGCFACCGGSSAVGIRSRGCWAATYAVEKELEHLLYGCQDCAIAACRLRYLCPRFSARSIPQRPCGGSAGGRCDWTTRMYLGPRLRAAEALWRVGGMLQADHVLQCPVEEHLLLGNFYLDRDHSARPNADRAEGKRKRRGEAEG